MRKFVYAFSMAALFAGAAAVLSAQGPPPQARGWVHIPDSTVERLADLGVAAHTNHLIRVEPMGTAGPTGQTPQSLWNLYANTDGSNPGPDAADGSRVIAIVGAFHYGTALQDFNTFSSRFGLPVESSTNPLASTNRVFQVVYAGQKQPRANCGWAQEAALDIEWSHAMAPGAKIVLVEANSNSYADLFKAVDKATSIVAAAGGGQVSMSWGGAEFSAEGSYDSRFKTGQGVVYFAASGDTGGVTIYPSTSPNVVAVGGTTIVNLSTRVESAWSGSGGGVSAYELKPFYQGALSGSKRMVPDVALVANPNTGVSVYDSTPCQGMSGWMVFGGTSASAPALAGIVNSANSFSIDSPAQLNRFYTNLGSGFYYDVASGSAGSFLAVPGYDLVTGVGTPRGFGGM